VILVRAQHEVEVERPIEVVFDFVADGANNLCWQPRIVETIRQSPQEGVGATYRQRIRHSFGFKVSADYGVTDFDRPRLLRFEVTSGGPIRPRGAYELNPMTPATTRVRFSVEYERRGRMPVLAPLLLIVRRLFG
jgi:hypothetical protein